MTNDFTKILLAVVAVVPLAAAVSAAGEQGRFTRLAKLPAPRIVDSATAFPGGHYNAANILDGNVRTEYASHGKGVKTFIEFDFGRPVSIAAFQHQNRNDIALVAASELVFLDASGKTVGTESVTHVAGRSGVTFWPLAKPIGAQRVRWRPTQSPLAGSPCLGGAEIAFYASQQSEPLPKSLTIATLPATLIDRQNDRLAQALRLAVTYPYAQPCQAQLEVEGAEPRTLQLGFGRQELTLTILQVKSPRPVRYALRVQNQAVVEGRWTIEPVRPVTIYIMPHSHVDIGYTEHQSEIEKKQIRNIARGIELARATAGYPEGARYKWNVEVLWAVESYLRDASPEKKQEFFDAVRKGQVGLQAMYGNELTGLCRPEELMQLFAYATRLGRECGVPIDSAMISDVPGYTWGTVTAMAQAGVKYWSIGPNYTDRIGSTRDAWEDKPFYWIGPSGKEKVLCSLPYFGYALSHLTPPEKKSQRVLEILDYLRNRDYPYDIVLLRWSGYGDNAVPDESLSDWIKAWNQQYAWPRLAMATASEAFGQFEKRYGDKLPQVRGDWTPYWEDGAGSTARETALNRISGDRLVQADVLWALLAPHRRPAKAFADAWRNVLLYSEHTWGAHCSISKPDDPFTTRQWQTKQAFAVDADKQSRKLLTDALGATAGLSSSAGNTGGQATRATRQIDAVEVFNTIQWTRSDLALLPAGVDLAGKQLVDADGKPVARQRQAAGQWAFLARDVPAFGAKRFRLVPGESKTEGTAKAEGNRLSTSLLNVEIDAATGAVKSLRRAGLAADLVDTQAPVALNDYRYVLGTDTTGATSNGRPKIEVVDAGPLVATLRITSDAPGCNRLVREVRVVDGLDRVELTNHVDRKPVREKDAVHFGFGFHVPGGTVRMETPWAVVRPNADQMPGACRNWFTVQRWVDVSNAEYGVTWAPLDAPLVEVGAMTANLLGPVPLEQWLPKAVESQTIYSWAQNNHWHTNYKADQAGVTMFRYVLRPHAKGYSGADSARFGLETSRPLVVVGVDSHAPAIEPLLSVASSDVLVETVKTSDDGRAYVVRLFGVAGKDTAVRLQWRPGAVRAVWLSDLSEQPLRRLEGDVPVPGSGVVTLRADLP